MVTGMTVLAATTMFLILSLTVESLAFGTMLVADERALVGRRSGDAAPVHERDQDHGDTALAVELGGILEVVQHVLAYDSGRTPA
jgi:hypothetical protein